MVLIPKTWAFDWINDCRLIADHYVLENKDYHARKCRAISIEKTSTSLFTIFFTYIFLFREQSQQEHNQVNDIYSFFGIPARASFCYSLFSQALIFLHANSLLIILVVITKVWYDSQATRPLQVFKKKASQSFVSRGTIEWQENLSLVVPFL